LGGVSKPALTVMTIYSEPKVIIIILNWNGLNDTLECLESVKIVTYSNYSTILVDNGSEDGSVDIIRRAYPDIDIIENGRNLGFAEGNNVGIRKALGYNSDYILLLNNDTVVTPGFLKELVEASEKDENIGIVGPKICYYDEPSLIWSVGGRINLFTGSFRNIGENRNEKNYTGVNNVDYVTGCALLIKTEVIKKIGLMDTDYFLYFEETDWNVKAKKAGYLTVVNCNTHILHKVGASIKKVKGIYYYYNARNTLLFMKNNGNWYNLITFLPIYSSAYLLMAVYNLIGGQREGNRYIYEGIKDYMKKEYGPYGKIKLG
jgi:hypothetical protein